MVESAPHRKIEADAHEAGALDWGCENYGTLSRSLDDVEIIPNDRFYNEAAEALKEAQRNPREKKDKRQHRPSS